MKGDCPKRSTCRICLICCALLSSLYLTSCASHQKYPSEWSALIPIEGDTCPDISGTYDIKDEGTSRRYVPDDPNRKTFLVQTTDDTLSHLYLYEVFPMKYFISRGRISDATHAQISQPDDDTLEIVFLDNQGLIDKKIYSRKKKEYACSPKGITLNWGHGSLSYGLTHGMGGTYPYAMGATGAGKYYLAKSIDGSLIIKEEGTALGVFIIIPFGESYDIWNRFKVYKK